MISHEDIRRFAREASLRIEGIRAGAVRVPRDQVFQELETVVEELQVSGEELRVQNEELLDLLGDLDGERSRSRTFFELAPVPLLCTDRTGRIDDANDAALRLLGLREEFLARKPLAVYVATADRRAFRAHLDRVRRQGATPGDPPGELEVSLEGRDGESVPVSLRGRPLPGRRDAGQILWSVQDLRPQREREEARRRLEREKAEREAAQDVIRRALFLLRSLTDLSRVADACGVAERAARTAADEFGALAVVDVVEGDGVRRTAAGPGADATRATTPSLEGPGLFARLVESGSSLEGGAGEVEALVRHLFGDSDERLPREGSPRGFLVLPMIAPRGVVGSLALVRAEDDGLLRPAQALLARGFAQVVGLALEQALRYEETARERARLEAVSQERFQALTALSHELRTPLHSILGYCDLLLDGVRGELDPEVRRMLSAVRSSARHQTEVVNGALELFRSEAVHEPLHPTDVVVQDVLEEALALVEGLARGKGLDLRSELPPEPVRGRIDAGKLRQVLVNLLGNGVKYTRDGHVCLRCAHEDGHIEIEVEDTGVGIPADQVERVFEPFWRSGGQSGTGLGLAVTRRIVRLLGGEISVASRDGEGSVFRVRVPLERDDAEDTPAV